MAFYMVTYVIQVLSLIAIGWLGYVIYKQIKKDNQALTQQFKEIQEKHRRHQKECEKRERAYRQALRSRDKTKALKLGRDYYGYLRSGQLTLEDERSLTKDIRAMR